MSAAIVLRGGRRITNGEQQFQGALTKTEHLRAPFQSSPEVERVAVEECYLALEFRGIHVEAMGAARPIAVDPGP